MNGGESVEVSSGALASSSPPPSATEVLPDQPGGGVEETDSLALRVVEQGSEVMSPAKFSFSAPMDNLVVRTHQYPVS